VAAWGLFDKRDVNSLSRVVSARTLDGYKVRAKLALSYPRPLLPSEAEEVMMKYARAYASAVECELSNGNLPWDDRELLDRIAEKVADLPKNRIRIIGLHIWQKGAVSSGSLKAINPDGNPTVPQMQAVQAPRSSNPAGASSGSGAAVTVRAPAARSLTPAFGYRSATPGGMPAMQTPPGGVAIPTPQPAPVAARATSPAMPTVRAPASAPRTQPIPATSGSMGAVDLPSAMAHSGISTPAQHAVTQPPIGRHPASASHHAVNAPPPSSQHAAPGPPPSSSYAASAPAASGQHAVAAPSVDSSPMPASARMASGVVPAVETRILRSKSGFMLALEQCQDSQGTLVGAALATPVRDAAAAVLFSALEAVNTWLPDPLSLLDGRVDEETRSGLVGEACVCVSYLLYEALARTSIPQMLAIEVVQAACVEALMGKPMPVSEISRYLATESPREEFTARVCTLLAIRETPDMQKKVDATLRFLRQEVRLCADKVQQRLLKTG
jgi:hypothetical protein